MRPRLPHNLLPFRFRLRHLEVFSVSILAEERIPVIEDRTYPPLAKEGKESSPIRCCVDDDRLATALLLQPLESGEGIALPAWPILRVHADKTPPYYRGNDKEERSQEEQPGWISWEGCSICSKRLESNPLPESLQQSTERDGNEAALIERDLGVLRNAQQAAQAAVQAAQVPPEARNALSVAQEAFSNYEAQLALMALRERAKAQEAAFLSTIAELMAATGTRHVSQAFTCNPQLARVVNFNSL